MKSTSVLRRVHLPFLLSAPFPSVATAASLSHNKELPTGIYTVPVAVADLQDFGKTQTVTVRICQCRNGRCLAKDSSVSLGGLAVLAMLLPLLLLLLLCE